MIALLLACSSVQFVGLGGGEVVVEFLSDDPAYDVAWTSVSAEIPAEPEDWALLPLECGEAAAVERQERVPVWEAIASGRGEHWLELAAREDGIEGCGSTRLVMNWADSGYARVEMRVWVGEAWLDLEGSTTSAGDIEVDEDDPTHGSVRVFSEDASGFSDGEVVLTWTLPEQVVQVEDTP